MCLLVAMDLFLFLPHALFEGVAKYSSKSSRVRAVTPIICWRLAFTVMIGQSSMRFSIGLTLPNTRSRCHVAAFVPSFVKRPKFAGHPFETYGAMRVNFENARRMLFQVLSVTPMIQTRLASLALRSTVLGSRTGTRRCQASWLT